MLLRIDPISCRVLVVGAIAAASFGGVERAHGAVSASVAVGVLTVTGDAADDSIAPRCVGGILEVPGAAPPGGPFLCSGINAVNVVGGAGADAIDLAGITAPEFPLSLVVTVNAGEGNDAIIGSEFEDVLSGEGGDDILKSTPGTGDDTLFGGAGTDTTRVTGTPDDEVFTVRSSPLVLNGGAVDLVGAVTTRVHFGGIETLIVDGAAGADTLLGLDASTVQDLSAAEFHGGVDDDLIGLDNWAGAAATALGGAGADTLAGGAGPEVLVGGPGNDFVTGGRGNDVTKWSIGDGRDTLVGGLGQDTHMVFGSPERDIFTVDLRKEGAAASFVRILRSGSRTGDLFDFDRVELLLGDGSDAALITESFSAFTFGVVAIDGGTGADSMTVRGTTSADKYTLRSVGSKIELERGEAATYGVELAATEEIDIRTRTGADTVDASGVDAGVDFEAFGGRGADTLTGGAGGDRLVGGPGRDVLRGKRGNDRILGQRGRDTMLGGSGADTLHGAAGKDVASGGSGADKATGGLGADLLRGGAGVDTLDGGGGGDTLVGNAGNDRLFGRRGADTLLGGVGADTLDGGSGFDVARRVDTPPGIVDLLRRIERIE